MEGILPFVLFAKDLEPSVTRQMLPFNDVMRITEHTHFLKKKKRHEIEVMFVLNAIRSFRDFPFPANTMFLSIFGATSVALSASTARKQPIALIVSLKPTERNFP